MRINKYLLIGLVAFLAFSCKSDDDDLVTIPVRDRGEQAIEDDQALLDYLSTHFYNYEEFENPGDDFDYKVKFDTIAGENSNKTPIIESDKLITKTVNYQGIDQQMYILKIREGVGAKPTFADSTYVTYKGELLNGTVFDNTTKSPVWFNLSPYSIVRNGVVASKINGVIEGFKEGLQFFGSASGYTVNADNTIKWNNDYGIGAIFIPSGLGYFNIPRAGIPSYSPLVFQFDMLIAVEADHDNDGIPSYLEDLDGDKDVSNDDSDEDGIPNNSDADDDGDGTPTRDEIEIAEDGTIIFTDSNNDGTPDYLDPDTFQ
ncbi:FKBP-type peptidyl-prolyl cis-trans isomerase [Christiangramia aquimixticola]|uniref:FKBP-type peptidyl-prolyl cis-trans isomerase n=1 Tax=Christiangramia aquimixticola TaxID=1697558 RepID=UPI003AA9C9DB